MMYINLFYLVYQQVFKSVKSEMTETWNLTWVPKKPTWEPEFMIFCMCCTALQAPGK